MNKLKRRLLIVSTILLFNIDFVFAEDISACENPEILKIIYFGNLILNVAKIIIPIGLIVFGMIDFSKAMTLSDETAQKKSTTLFIKRIIYAILIFAVPWIVETLIVSLGNLTEGVNFTDCIENANEEKIAELEDKIGKEEPSGSNGNNNSNTGDDKPNNNGNNDPSELNTDISSDVIENIASFVGSETGFGDTNMKEYYWTTWLFQAAVFMNNYGSWKSLNGVDINTKVTKDSVCKVFKTKFSGGGLLYSPGYCEYDFKVLANKRNGGKALSDNVEKGLNTAITLVLEKKFTIPKNILEARGQDNASGKGVIYEQPHFSKYYQQFATGGAAFSSKDIYGNTVSTDPKYYTDLASKLYDQYMK